MLIFKKIRKSSKAKNTSFHIHNNTSVSSPSLSFSYFFYTIVQYMKNFREIIFSYISQILALLLLYNIFYRVKQNTVF